jgi:hypothetical protein
MKKTRGQKSRATVPLTSSVFDVDVNITCYTGDGLVLCQALHLPHTEHRLDSLIEESSTMETIHLGNTNFHLNN